MTKIMVRQRPLWPPSELVLISFFSPMGCRPSAVSHLTPIWGRCIPLLAKEGWTRHLAKWIRSENKARTGWSLTCDASVCVCETCRVSDHPVCGSSVASRLLIDAAATPPLQGGECTQTETCPLVKIS